jgi:pimeloyl-ACP methyl ester carboxylesterase
MSADELETVTITTADGRALEVIAAGPPDGLPLIFHHGTPGAAGIFDDLVAVGAERNVRHITYSRPGYGRSERLAGRSVASCAADVVAIADSLGYDRFYSIGASGGASHSLACAALLADRVIAAATIASPAPIDAEGLDWNAGMGKENIEEFAAARAGDRELADFLERMARDMKGSTGDQIVAALGDLVSEVDREALSGAFGDYLAGQLSRSLSPGISGWFDDDRAILSRWGFELDQIAVPLSIWHGAQDRFVPISHGEWLAAHVTADVQLRPGDGHLSLAVSSYGEILDALLGNR